MPASVSRVTERATSVLSSRGAARGGPVTLKVHQRMGQHQVLLPDVLVVPLDVVLELGPVLGEVVPRGGHGHDADVQEVGRASHHPAAGPGPVGHHPPPALQLGDGAGDDEGKPDPVSGAGRDVCHLIHQSRVVLHVVKARKSMDGVAQGGVAGDVLHSLPGDVHLRRPLLQPRYVLQSRPRGHHLPPLRPG